MDFEKLERVEVKIVNKYGECVEALPIFKNM